MSYKFPFFILAVGVIVAGAIPIGLSQTQTEPSMEIDMLVGQTQNPFRIQDNNDNNEFCIRTDGSSCAGTWNTWKYESGLEETITATDCGFNDYQWANGTIPETEDCIISQLDVIQLAGTGEEGSFKWFTQNGELLINAQIKRDVGTGVCTIKLMSHDEVENFYRDNDSGVEVSATTATYTPDRDSMYGSFNADTSSDIENFRLVIDTGSAGTTCSFKSIGFIMELPDWNFLQYDIIKDGL